jgi:AcrR family transcriptional regulator
VSESEPLLPQKPERQRAEQQRAADTIKILIDATVQQIQLFGESSVNVKDISEQTGISYGAIYHHFKDRAGLIRAAQFERLRNQPGGDLASLGQALDTAGDLGDFVLRIKAIADSIADPSRAAVRLVRASVMTTSLNDPELREALTRLESDVMNGLTDLITQAQALGIADPAIDPRAAAVYLEALSYGIVLMEFMENRPTPEALSEVLLRGFMALLAPSP